MEELETKKYAGIDLGRTSVQFSIYREGQEEMTEESFLLSEEEHDPHRTGVIRKQFCLLVNYQKAFLHVFGDHGKFFLFLFCLI